MDPEDFDVEVVDDWLVIRGEKRFEREETRGNWRVAECAYGSFERAIPLPAAVDPERARAQYRKGVLRVELPKRQSERRRLVPVRVR
ncbi:MAG: hypothetical protein KatS3mg124_1347 [Porticoccaceae bacterium]|nr:MAG: hypothetical protein KatS3mg124_1347 [Porticoccaceae bacterium]